MVTEPSANVYNIGSVDSLLGFVNPIKIKVLLIPNKMLEYCKTILQNISFSELLFKKEYKKTFNYLNGGERVELKTWPKAKVSIIPNEENKSRVASAVGVIRQNKNITAIKLDEKPRIDPITISIPILFWITIWIEWYLRS